MTFGCQRARCDASATPGVTLRGGISRSKKPRCDRRAAAGNRPWYSLGVATSADGGTGGGGSRAFRPGPERANRPWSKTAAPVLSCHLRSSSILPTFAVSRIAAFIVRHTSRRFSEIHRDSQPFQFSAIHRDSQRLQFHGDSQRFTATPVSRRFTEIHSHSSSRRFTEIHSDSHSQLAQSLPAPRGRTAAVVARSPPTPRGRSHGRPAGPEHAPLVLNRLLPGGPTRCPAGTGPARPTAPA